MAKINLSKLWTNSKKRLLLIFGYFLTGSVIVSVIKNYMNRYIPNLGWQLILAIGFLVLIIYLDMKDKSWGYF